MTRGSYSTKQKELILNEIRNHRHEFSVKDIFSKIPDISITTIYRFINKLEKEGVINKIVGHDGNTYYQYIEKCDCDHFYLKCDQCGSLTHIECSFINELSNHIIHDHQFHLNKDHIMIHGICNYCYKKEGCI